MNRISLVLLFLMIPGGVTADEHKYSAFVGGSHSRSNPTWGLHVAYEDTTKRPLFRPRTEDRKKHPWSAVLDVSVEADGPENLYTALLGGRRSWAFGASKYFVFSGQLLGGYTTITGAKNRIRLSAVDEEARTDGFLVGGGIGLDYLLFEEYSSDARYKIEDGPRAQIDAIYQVSGTHGLHLRFSLGWVIRYR